MKNVDKKQSRAVAKYLLILTTIIASIGIYTVFTSRLALAHPNVGVNWSSYLLGGSCPGAGPPPPQTGYGLYYNSSTSRVDIDYGTNSYSANFLIGETKVCPDSSYSQANNVRLDIWNIDSRITNVSGMFFGTVTKDPLGPFTSWPNQTQSRQPIINTSGWAANSYNSVCFNWQGVGYYSNNFESKTGVNTFCIDFYVRPPVPPPPPPVGNILVTKYGSWEWNNMCIRQEGQSATLACNWYSQVAKNNVSSSVRYNVQADPTSPATVLAGFRLNYYDGNGLHSCHSGEFPGANDSGLNGLYGLLCYYANVPGRTFGNLPVSTGNTTYLDLYYKDVPPVGNFEKLTCDTTNERLDASGWAMDLSKSGKAIDVALYYAGDANGPGTQYITTTASGLGRAGENWSGVSLNGHLFNAQLPASLYDGTQHYVYAYALGIDKNGNRNNDNTFIGVKTITCTPRPKLYPWLQTQKGDVISLKNIIGQEIGTIPNLLTDHPGARHGNSGNKNTPFSGSPAADQQNPESYFVIAEGTTDTVSNHFCSANLYTLGSPQNDNQEACGLRNSYPMSGINIDQIKESLQSTWDQNGAGNNTTCSPYRTRLIGTGLASLINGDITLGCQGGGIQRNDSDYSLSGFFAAPNPTITGRGTLWVKGNLTIGKNITYGATGTFTNPKNLPNFAIFVEGDVTIDQNVTQIDAMIIATGKIYTCTQSNVSTAACGKSLKINGLLASKGKIDFGRRWFNKDNPNTNSAENIILTGQSIILPPPGLDKRDSSIDSSLQINSGELSPRLN